MTDFEVGSTPPPISKCGAAATTADLRREMARALIDKMRFS